MKNRIILIISLILWAAVAWRVLAFNSAKLGPVQLMWRNVQTPQTVFAWSPNVASYSFYHHNLVLQPGQTATLLIRPPVRFTKGIVSVTNTAVTVATKNPGATPHLQQLSVVWRNVPRTPSGYIFTLQNTSNQPTFVSPVILKLIP